MNYTHNKVRPYEKETLSKKQEIEKMFDSVAPKYDFLNGFLSLGIDTLWRRKAVKKMVVDQPKYILDMATGTGDLAIEIAKQVPQSKVMGVDLSKEMLNYGQKKLEKKQLTDRIELSVGDSENLSFEDNTFDASSVAFGVRNFENLDKGLTELYRVLKPGGKLMILEFTKPTIFPFKQLFNFYFKYILPTIGKFTSKDPKAYKYLYESVQAFPDRKQFVKILGDIGFTKNESYSLSLGICTIYLSEK